MRFLPVNLHSFLLELASLDETLALYESLCRRPLVGIEEIIPAARTLLIRFNPPQLRDSLAGQIRQRLAADGVKDEVEVGVKVEAERHMAQRQQRLVVIPVRYHGEDLPAVAELYGISVQELIKRHQQTSWKVAFMGFAPGFAYLVADGQRAAAAGLPEHRSQQHISQQHKAQQYKLHQQIPADLTADNSTPDIPMPDHSTPDHSTPVHQWQTPRQPIPRTRIPPGSVALAGEFSGVYPQASPGGWQLIGQTHYQMWDIHRPQPALLQPACTVRFVDERQNDRLISLPARGARLVIENTVIENTVTESPVAGNTVTGNTATETNVIKNPATTSIITKKSVTKKTNTATPTAKTAMEQPPLAAISLSADPAPMPEDSPATDKLLTIINPGLQTSWQDNGRSASAAMGISAAGAMDKAAWREANRLVGNGLHTPCLEISQGGFHGRAQQDLVMAVTGAPCPLRLLIAGKSYPVSFAAPFSLAAGDEIMLGAPVAGVRSYLAIRGGCTVERILGSAAWHSLAKLGAQPLQPGQVLTRLAGAAMPSAAVALQPLALPPLPDKHDTVTLDIIAGPRTDWFTDQAWQILLEQRWQVSPQADRVGLRLQGEKSLVRRQLRELPSEATCCGAIQVPASGQPVLFLRDHPLTGGYPVIAAVADYHLDLAGQIPPGGWLRFHLIQPFIELAGAKVT